MTSLQYTETKYMLTVQETARILGVSIHTVYKLISSGELSAVKVSQKNSNKSRGNKEVHQQKIGGLCHEGNDYTKRDTYS